MKKTILIAALALAGAASNLIAQDGPPPGDRPPRREGGPGGPGGPGRPGGPGGEGRRMPPPPLFAVLDSNHDGVIDEHEIANASESLKKLDKNHDGKITPEELRPPRPEGDHGPGGPEGDRPAFRGPPRDRPDGGQPDGEARRPQRPPSDQ
jgi:hypothetical protein